MLPKMSGYVKGFDEIFMEVKCQNEVYTLTFCQ